MATSTFGTTTAKNPGGTNPITQSPGYKGPGSGTVAPGRINNGSGGTGDTPMSPDDASASGTINDYLGRYGLASLGSWAWGLYLQGYSVDEIFLRMQDTPEYKARFPAMAELQKQGKAISVEAYRSYEETVRNNLHAAGIPEGMYDSPEAIAKMLVNDVSPQEVQARIDRATAAAYSAPASVRQAMADRFGVQPGDLTALWLDTDKALPLLEQRYASAAIKGAAADQGVGTDVTTADRLAAQGFTYQQGLQGFGEVKGTEAYGSGPFEQAGQDERTAAAFGDAAAQRAVARVAKSRGAGFGQGGGAAQTQTGIGGIGSASSR